MLVVGDADDAAMSSSMQAAAEVEDGDSSATVAVLIGRDELSTASNQGSAARLAEAYGLSVVMYDGSGELVADWAERNPPKSYVIDASMGIAWTRFGSVSSSDLLGALDDL